MELKGKPLSLGAKILAVVLVLAGLALKLTILPDLDFDVVIKAALFIVGVFGTVDLSLIAQNIFGRKV